MKLIWLTDIHLNFLGLIERKAFYAQISTGFLLMVYSFYLNKLLFEGVT